MLRKLPMFVGVLAASLAGQSIAQNNPLSSLFSELHKIGKPQDAQVQAPGHADLTAILNIYMVTSGNSVDGACAAIQRPERVQTDMAELKQKDYGMAAAGFRLYAADVAYCAVGTIGINHVQRIPLSLAYAETGRNLAMSAIAMKLDNAVLPQTIQMAHDAMSLLEADPIGNASIIADLKSTGLVGEGPSPIPSFSDAISFQATAAVAAYKANTFGFKTKYAGRTLQVTGNIKQIDGNSRGATVTLTGFKPANMENQGFQDIVRCNVTDPGNMAAVADLATDKTVKVVGFYQPDHQVMPVGIELQHCRVE